MSKPKPMPLTVSGLENFTATPTPGASAQKSELLEIAAFIEQVKNDDEATEAVEAAGNIKALEQAVEKCRKEIKDPVLKAGYVIDDAAKRFVRELAAERNRLEMLVAQFMQDKRRAHAVALQREAQEREKALLAQAEVATKLQEAQDAAEAASLAGLPDSVMPEIPAAPEVKVPVVPIAPPTVQGANFRESLEFEITDIHALYAWETTVYPRHGRFVKLEPVKTELNTYINREDVDPSKIPGIKVFVKTKLSARATRPTMSIDNDDKPLF